MSQAATVPDSLVTAAAEALRKRFPGLPGLGLAAPDVVRAVLAALPECDEALEAIAGFQHRNESLHRHHSLDKPTCSYCRLTAQFATRVLANEFGGQP